MSWDEVAVPFKVAVNLNQTVEASLHNQLRGLSQYTWDAWDDAATYMVDNKMDVNEALKYEDKSIQNEERFENLMTKSRILDAMGEKDQAAVAHNKALSMGNAQQLYGYARQLQRQKQQDEAFAVFRTIDKKYPDNWLAHAGMSRIYCGQGDYAKATEQMKLALASAPDMGKPGVESLIKRLEAKDDINKRSFGCRDCDRPLQAEILLVWPCLAVSLSFVPIQGYSKEFAYPVRSSLCRT